MEDARIKTLKMKKIKIIANFALIQRLMVFSYNTVHDLDNVETEYKAHINVCKLNERNRQAYLWQRYSSRESEDLNADKELGRNEV